MRKKNRGNILAESEHVAFHSSIAIVLIVKLVIILLVTIFFRLVLFSKSFSALSTLALESSNRSY